MFHRAVAAGMPFGYVAGDEVYGRCPTLRAAIEQAGYGYVLEVGCDFRVCRHPGDTSRVDALLGEVPRWGWEHRCQGPGAKGLRTHAWAWIALDPAGCPDGWARSLLIRRDPDAEPDGDEQYAYFLCYHRRGTTLGELIGVAGRRWGIEESFAITKSEAGLDEHQVRRWTAWYRHAILSMLAAAFLAVDPRPPPGKPHRLAGGLIPHTCNEIRSARDVAQVVGNLTVADVDAKFRAVPPVERVRLVVPERVLAVEHDQVLVPPGAQVVGIEERAAGDLIVLLVLRLGTRLVPPLAAERHRSIGVPRRWGRSSSTIAARSPRSATKVRSIVSTSPISGRTCPTGDSSRGSGCGSSCRSG